MNVNDDTIISNDLNKLKSLYKTTLDNRNLLYANSVRPIIPIPTLPGNEGDIIHRILEDYDKLDGGQRSDLDHIRNFPWSDEDIRLEAAIISEILATPINGTMNAVFARTAPSLIEPDDSEIYWISKDMGASLLWDSNIYIEKEDSSSIGHIRDFIGKTLSNILKAHKVHSPNLNLCRKFDRLFKIFWVKNSERVCYFVEILGEFLYSSSISSNSRLLEQV